jgi:hypothetical protein
MPKDGSTIPPAGCATLLASPFGQGERTKVRGFCPDEWTLTLPLSLPKGEVIRFDIAMTR